MNTNHKKEKHRTMMCFCNHSLHQQGAAFYHRLCRNVLISPDYFLFPILPFKHYVLNEGYMWGPHLRLFIYLAVRTSVSISNVPYKHTVLSTFSSLGPDHRGCTRAAVFVDEIFSFPENPLASCCISCSHLVEVAEFPEEDQQLLVELDLLAGSGQIRLDERVIEQPSQTFKDKAQVLMNKQGEHTLINIPGDHAVSCWTAGCFNTSSLCILER